MDFTYIILVLPAIIFSFICSSYVKSTYKKYSKVQASRGITGYNASRAILQANCINGVSYAKIPGQLNDYFSPGDNQIVLSQESYDTSSVAAIGVACHETGHAVQYADNYLPSRIRTAIVPATNFGAKISTPLLIGGLFLSSYSEKLISLSYLGLICFGLSVVFQLVTLPVEFNASRRAIQGLRNTGIMTEEELKGVKKVLTAAALTYVAALTVSLTQLIRFMMLVNRRRD